MYALCNIRDLGQSGLKLSPRREIPDLCCFNASLLLGRLGLLASHVLSNTMEVAGVVLGAIPIALYALDNYNRCLTVAKDVIRYQATLETFRLHIFIQRQQLLVTLRNLGMPLAHDRLPDKTELKSHLERLYPESNAEFMSIIAQMERHLATLLDKLDVDSRGKVCYNGTPACPPDFDIYDDTNCVRSPNGQPTLPSEQPGIGVVSGVA